jgi:hypothetical protein
MITEVGMNSAYADMSALDLPPGSSILPATWDSGKDEVCYFTVPIGEEPHDDFEVAFFIAFGPIEPVAGLPAIPHLFAIAGEVKRIVEETEIEASRIGLIK